MTKPAPPTSSIQSPCGEAGGCEERAALLDARLQAELKARDRLISEAAHDLRSPLNGLQGWAHVLESRLDADASPILRKALDGIKTGIQQQVELIADLADMRGVLDQTLAMDFAAVDPAELLPRALQASAATAQARKVTLAERAAVAPGLMLQADAARLVRALQTVIVHCVRCAMEGDEIPVGAETSGDGLSWFVGDVGEGRPAAGLAGGRARVPAALRLAECLICLHGGTVQHVPLDEEGVQFGYRVHVPLAGLDPASARATAAARAAMPAALPRVGLIAQGEAGARMGERLRALGIEPAQLEAAQADAAEVDVLLVPSAAAQEHAPKSRADGPARVTYGDAVAAGAALSPEVTPQCLAARLQLAVAAKSGA